MIKNKTLKAAGWYTVSNFISKCIIYLLTPYYARLLTEAEYGQLSNLSSWRNILLVVITFDLYSTVTVAYIDYNEKEFKKYIASITVFSVFFPLIICSIMFMFGETVASVTSIGSNYLPIMFISIIFNAPLLIFQAVQRSQVRYKAASVLTMLSSISMVVFTVVFVSLLEDKLLGVISGSFIGSILINIMLIVVMFRGGMCFKLEHIKYALRIAIPLIPHIIGTTILGTSDKIMITKICGDEANAHYSLVYTCSMVVTMLVSSINSAWVPWFYNKLKSKELNGVRKVVQVLAPILGLCSFIISITAPEIVLIIGGKSYIDSAYIMPPIISSCFINYIYTLYVNIIFYDKKTIWISIGTVSACVINIILNYFFINTFGYMAAAYTTLFSNIFMLLVNYFVSKTIRKGRVYDDRYLAICSVIVLILCILCIITYKSYAMRIGYLAIVFFAFLVVILKNKKRVFEICSIIKKRGDDNDY